MHFVGVRCGICYFEMDIWDLERLTGWGIDTDWWVWDLNMAYSLNCDSFPLIVLCLDLTWYFCFISCFMKTWTDNDIITIFYHCYLCFFIYVKWLGLQWVKKKVLYQFNFENISFIFCFYSLRGWKPWIYRVIKTKLTQLWRFIYGNKYIKQNNHLLY